MDRYIQIHLSFPRAIEVENTEGTRVKVNKKRIKVYLGIVKCARSD